MVALNTSYINNRVGVKKRKEAIAYTPAAAR